jgi:hypothetical protein
MAWRPVPIIPILILFEGAVLPVADAGMILGTTIAPAVIREDFLRKSLLDL